MHRHYSGARRWGWECRWTRERVDGAGTWRTRKMRKNLRFHELLAHIRHTIATRISHLWPAAFQARSHVQQFRRRNARGLLSPFSSLTSCSSRTRGCWDRARWPCTKSMGTVQRKHHLSGARCFTALKVYRKKPRPSPMKYLNSRNIL